MSMQQWHAVIRWGFHLDRRRSMLCGMTASSIAFDLPTGWTCSVEFQQDPEGTFAGKAELRQGLIPRCVLVVTQQSTREAAFEHIQFQADDFIAEWNSRPTTAASEAGLHLGSA